MCVSETDMIPAGCYGAQKQPHQEQDFAENKTKNTLLLIAEPRNVRTLLPRNIQFC